MPVQVQLSDGRVELQDRSRIEASPLYNEDLAPVPITRRTWTTYNYAALWISMAHCIPTYMLASGLIASGMNWWQALLTVGLGNTIVLIPILLNSHPGTKYGIPFPVFARAAYGTIGSNLPALMRALVACGWFGIQAWIGGEALNTFFANIIPGWPTLLGAGAGGHTTTEWLSFLLFWGLNVFVIYRGMDLLRHVENWAAPFVLVMTAALLAWAIWRADGLGPLLADRGRFTTARDFFKVFVPSLTAMIGFWATLSLNMPDFTRFGRSQREQIVGQVVALPTTMFIFAAMGVMITSATAVIYGQLIWHPIELVGRFRDPFVVAVSMFTAVVATLAVNIAANVVSPANDFANAFPRAISFKTGGLITGLLGIAIQPWRLLADPSGYIYTWLLGYSGGLGSIAGVLIADYWIVRRTELALEDLYLPDGRYRYTAGWHVPGAIATVAGCAAAWCGVVIPPLRPLYDYAWFVGFGVAALAYLALTRRPASPAHAVARGALALALVLGGSQASTQAQLAAQAPAGFDAEYAQLKQGRTYTAAPKGALKRKHGAHAYWLVIPAAYDPAKKYQVRVQLHGGVMRDDASLRGDGTVRLAGAEQIYIMPAGWSAAPWWSDAQLSALRGILDDVKREYNVDENRVVVSGVSDGGTGAYYVAMRDTTPYAAFLPLNGYVLVLRNPDLQIRSGLFLNNLRNKPLYIVNGGKDPLYPTEAVEPSVGYMRELGVPITYRPRPEAGHDTSWWPAIGEDFERFVAAHPRVPLPDTLTWEVSDTRAWNRAHWLIIDALGSTPSDAKLDDPNVAGGQRVFPNGKSGRVDLTRQGNTITASTRGVKEFTLLLSPDQFDFTRNIVVRVNGRVAVDTRVEKSVETLRKWASRDNDRTMLFAAEIKIRP